MRNAALVFFLFTGIPGCGNDEFLADAPPRIDAAPAVDAAAPFVTLASFDPTLGQLAEGVTSIGGTPFVSLAPLGEVHRVPLSGATLHGTVPGAVTDTFTLGLAADAMGRIYVGVAQSGAAPAPAPGVYRVPAAGGTATLFASTAGMTFPNGLDFDGTALFVTDSSSGTVYEVAPNGTASVWIQDAVLAGDQTACGGSGAGFDIGANGIVHDATDRYVAVTDFGRIVRIPVMGNGSPGTPVVHAESCADLAGIDGIALDTDGSIIAVRNGPSNTMVRVSADGQARMNLHVGPPLDGPASVAIDAPGGDRRLLVTNSAFFSGPTGRPSLLAYDLP